jgi:serine/threonine-protein kinase
MSPAKAAPISVASPRERPGATVDERYKSLWVIGRGGMGSVEVALERGPNGYERVLALKRLLPEAARDPRNKEMFLREARLAALLSHPNVVHAFAYGDIQGELFLAMEYVEGQPLSSVLAAARSTPAGRLEPELVCLVLAEACEGLHAAHELCDVGGRPLRVVHRDVSPHNVMVAYDGRVKLLDFGVAKLEASSHETRTGEVKGKMAYMSPEQALGEKLDRRSDLYSIGAVLFECLTGQRMWGTGTDLEVLRRMALEAPPRLDQALPGALPALVDLHARLVAHSPDARPASALEVADALRELARTTATTDVHAKMKSLFAAEAARSQALLTQALTEAAPSEVEELRQSVNPEFAEGDTRTGAVVADAPAKRGSLAWAWAGVGAVVGAVIVAATVVAGSGAKGRAVLATEATAAVLQAPAPSSPVASQPATPSAQMTATAPLGAPAATNPVGALPGRSRAPRTAPKLPAKGPPAANAKMPDVDPAPF